MDPRSYTTSEKKLLDVEHEKQIEHQLDIVQQYRYAKKLEDRKEIMERCLTHAVGLELAKLQRVRLKSNPREAALQVLDLAKEHNSRYGWHECDSNTCDIRALLKGKVRDPLDPSAEVMSDETLYICFAIKEERQYSYEEVQTSIATTGAPPPGKKIVFLPGSLHLHWCDNTCRRTAMDTHSQTYRNGFSISKDDTGHCPITGRAKSAQILSVPSFNDVKIGAGKLQQMRAQDYKEYVGEDVANAAPHEEAQTSSKPESILAALDPAKPAPEKPATKRKNGRRPQSSLNTMNEKQRVTKYNTFRAVLDVITSTKSQRSVFHHTKYSSANVRAIGEVKRVFNSRKTVMPLSTQLAFYMKAIWDQVSERDDIPEFDLSSRAPFIFKRVALVWNMVVSSPLVQANISNKGSTKRNKPPKPSFESICAACIFGMAQQGIFVQYEPVQGSTLRGTFCFLPRDEDIAKSAIEPDKVSCVMNSELKADLGINDKTFRLAMSTIKESIGSYVKEYARKAEESINEGALLDDVVKTYIASCESLCVR